MEPGDYVRLPGGGWGRITSIQNTSNRARVVPMGRTFGNIPTNEPFGRAAAQAVFHPVQNLELLPQEYQGQELASFKTMREAQAEVAEMQRANREQAEAREARETARVRDELRRRHQQRVSEQVAQETKPRQQLDILKDSPGARDPIKPEKITLRNPKGETYGGFRLPKLGFRLPKLGPVPMELPLLVIDQLIKYSEGEPSVFRSEAEIEAIKRRYKELQALEDLPEVKEEGVVGLPAAVAETAYEANRRMTKPKEEK